MKDDNVETITVSYWAELNEDPPHPLVGEHKSPLNFKATEHVGSKVWLSPLPSPVSPSSPGIWENLLPLSLVPHG